MVSYTTLSKATELIAKKFKPKYIILFGSQARGEANDYSDVDLLVVCQYSGKRKDIMISIYSILDEMEFAKDIIVLKPEEYEEDKNIVGTIAYPAFREGIFLYGKDN